MNSSMMRISAIAGLVLTAGSMVSAANYDVTGQAGQYAETVVPTVVRGTTGMYVDATVYVPWLIDADNGPLQNSAVVQNVGGNLLGGVTTFSSGIFPKWVAAFGTTDAAGGGQSNNGFVLEGSANRSNSFGALLTDGTGVWRANFDFSTQNNLEVETLTLTNDPAPATTGANRVFGSGFAGIDGTSGSVFLGTPGAVRDAQGNLLTGNTTFDSFTGNTINGVGVYTNFNNNPAPGNASFEWLQTGSPVPTGESAGDARQTQPEMALVNSPSGAQQVYTCFGVGISGGAAIDGGSSEPIYFTVDRCDVNDGYTNAAYIEADGDGNLATANNALKFVDHQANGGGTQPFVNGQFSMNSAGEVAAILRDETVVPNVYRVMVYRPIWNGAGDRITGYMPGVEAARSGADTIVDTFQVETATPGVFNTIAPIAGASIADSGRVAFAAITEAIFDAGNPNILVSSTTDLMVWDDDTDTLHSIIRGGQNGTILADAFGADGGDLQLGFFATEFASDGFNREGFSDNGEYLAVAFRNGVANDPDIDGGVLNPGGAELAVRGVVTVDLGEFLGSGITDCNENGTDDADDILMGTSQDCNANGVPDECDIADGTSLDCNGNGVPDECEPAACPGDVTGDGFVNFDDLNVVLGNWNTMGDLCDGDATNDGTINFDDLNLVLANWNTNCN